MVQVPSSNAAVTVHKNMVIISSGPGNSEKIQPQVSAGQYDFKELLFQI